MIHLTLPRQPTYISPSTYMIAEECELSAAFLKWSGVKLKTIQTMPMAVGSAFDSFIKAEIAHLLGKPVVLAKLLETVEQPEAIPIGKQLAEQYVNQGCLRRLINEGLSDIELNFKEVEVFGVPVYCKPDSVLGDGTPIDWKVNGYGSARGGSVEIGYFRRIRNGMDLWINSPEQFFLHQINYKWAIQLIFYWWVQNQDKLDQLNLNANPMVKGRIEQVCITPNHVDFVSYQAYAQNTFVIELRDKVQALWQRVLKGEFMEPTPSESLCHPYGHPRPCTLVCPLYAAFRAGKSTGNSIVDEALKS
jgi:hypothetical protein